MPLKVQGYFSLSLGVCTDPEQALRCCWRALQSGGKMRRNRILQRTMKWGSSFLSQNELCNLSITATPKISQGTVSLVDRVKPNPHCLPANCLLVLCSSSRSICLPPVKALWLVPVGPQDLDQNQPFISSQRSALNSDSLVRRHQVPCHLSLLLHELGFCFVWYWF